MKKEFNVKKMVKASIFLAIAVILQLIQRNFTSVNPLLIGPLINTVLLLCTYTCGLTYGLILSILIPVFAIFTAALAPVMIPFSPFIILANILFTASFAVVMNRKYGIYLGALLASFVRFGFFSVASAKLIYVLNLGIAPTAAKAIGAAFGAPQLLVALLGSAVAVILIRALKRSNTAF